MKTATSRDRMTEYVLKEDDERRWQLRRAWLWSMPVILWLIVTIVAIILLSSVFTGTNWLDHLARAAAIVVMIEVFSMVPLIIVGSCAYHALDHFGRVYKLPRL